LSCGSKKEFAYYVSTDKHDKTRGDRIAKIVALCEAQKTCTTSIKSKAKSKSKNQKVKVHMVVKIFLKNQLESF
jgi:hypothetical protein